jgi:hypothetical protein
MDCRVCNDEEAKRNTLFEHLSAPRGREGISPQDAAENCPIKGEVMRRRAERLPVKGRESGEERERSEARGGRRAHEKVKKRDRLRDAHA